jgi:hypothetical protein
MGSQSNVYERLSTSGSGIWFLERAAIRQSPSPQTRSMPQRSNRSCESGPKIGTSHATLAISSLTLRKTRVSLSLPTKSDGVSVVGTHSITMAPANARSQSSSEYVAQSQCLSPGPSAAAPSNAAAQASSSSWLSAASGSATPSAFRIAARACRPAERLLFGSRRARRVQIAAG